MAETKHNLHCGRWLKQAATLDIASPDTCQGLKPPFEPFTSMWIHPSYNQPRVSRPKFRLETNSTVVWLYAGGVSLILPDERFGTVSLDWVTFEKLDFIISESSNTVCFFWMAFPPLGVQYYLVSLGSHLQPYTIAFLIEGQQLTMDINSGAFMSLVSK